MSHYVLLVTNYCSCQSLAYVHRGHCGELTVLYIRIWYAMGPPKSALTSCTDMGNSGFFMQITLYLSQILPSHEEDQIIEALYVLLVDQPNVINGLCSLGKSFSCRGSQRINNINKLAFNSLFHKGWDAQPPSICTESTYRNSIEN